MFIDPAAAASPNSNASLYETGGTVGILATGSDEILSADITITRIGWNNPSNKLVLNRSGTGHLHNFFSGNTSQSIYLVFDDGTYVELTNTAIDGGGLAWLRYTVPNNVIALFDAFDGTDRLFLGVGDAGSVGLDLHTGLGTVNLTALVPQPLGIESINEQFITMGTEDYDLVVNITGRPDSAKAGGHMEGFGQHWDAVRGQLHIKSEEVTRLINGVNWDIELVKDMQTLMGQVAYNVVQAAPIFASLGTIHLYRGVPINFDIIIQNIPPLLIPDSELLGLKSELVEYGVNVKGSIGATDNFSFNTGNVRIIVPSETGGDDTVYNYPYEIEAGSPPAIGTPVFTPKGHYGELEVADVTHALGYEWTLQEGDTAVWNAFSDARPVINPGQIEVTPGNFNVTIQFPNIAGASSYEYRLESDSHEVDWKPFTGTLANNMITTIIPDLREGVEYTLRLRVGSPWIGSAVSIPVYGGRLLYLLNFDASGSKIFIGSTGVADGGIMPIVKQIGLPASMNTNNLEGLAVSGTTAYVSDRTENVFVLDIDVADGGVATLSRQFNVRNEIVGGVTLRRFRLAIKGDVLYAPLTAAVKTFSALTANNTKAAIINRYPLRSGQTYIGVAVRDGVLIMLWHPNIGGRRYELWPDVVGSSRIKEITINNYTPVAIDVIDDFIYAVRSTGRLVRISTTTPDRSFLDLPLEGFRDIEGALLATDVRDISF